MDERAPLASPGMLARHYVPRTPLEYAGVERVRELARMGKRVGWVTWSATPVPKCGHTRHASGPDKICGKSLCGVARTGCAGVGANHRGTAAGKRRMAGDSRQVAARVPSIERFLRPRLNGELSQERHACAKRLFHSDIDDLPTVRVAQLGFSLLARNPRWPSRIFQNSSVEHPTDIVGKKLEKVGLNAKQKMVLGLLPVTVGEHCQSDAEVSVAQVASGAAQGCEQLLVRPLAVVILRGARNESCRTGGKRSGLPRNSLQISTASRWRPRNRKSNWQLKRSQPLRSRFSISSHNWLARWCPSGNSAKARVRIMSATPMPFCFSSTLTACSKSPC